MEEWIMTLSAWFCAFLMCVIGVWAYHRKTPMHFWSGTTVPSSEISDITAYNPRQCVDVVGIRCLLACGRRACIFRCSCVRGRNGRDSGWRHSGFGRGLFVYLPSLSHALIWIVKE